MNPIRDHRYETPGAATPVQKYRHAAIDTVLGQDRLLLQAFTGEEELSRLFHYKAVILDPEHHVQPDNLIGTNTTLRLELEDDTTRYFNGFISRLSFHGMHQNAGVYHAEIVPWLWLLTRTSDCRIFQNKSVPDILQEVFSENGFTDFDINLMNPHKAWEYCVQYNETDFNFVSRLMEHEGIYYYFKHENGRHTMMIVDDMRAHVTHPGAPGVEWHEHSGVFEEGYLYDMVFQKTVSPGRYAHSDYNFKEPKMPLLTDRAKEKPHAGAKFEIFEYPGVFQEPGDGEQLAALRVEELQTEYETVTALCTRRALSCGCRFELTKAERRDQEREYLITATRTHIQQDLYSPGGGSTGDKYECHITCIPTSSVFRPARVTPKPLIKGPQCALCVGPKGEEIYTDQFGRVKVHFYWDRRSKADERSSMWIRVCHPSAGKGWGQISLPRIGQEVIVEFLEGDPDRPIITGRVYNGENMPPYPLPADKTRSLIKTNSSKGGGGYNELRFEDLKGKEQIFIHGQKDMDVRIRERRRESIGIDAHLTVGSDSMTSIGNNASLAVGGDQKIEVNGTSNLTVGRDLAEKVGMNMSTEAGMSLRLEAGLNMYLKAGMNLTLEAGPCKIALTPAGIFITGPMVFINSGSGGVPVAKISPEKPKKPDPADDSNAGQVESAEGNVFAEDKQHWEKQTVHDQAAKHGLPFYEEPVPEKFTPAKFVPPQEVKFAPPPPEAKHVPPQDQKQVPPASGKQDS